MAKLAKVEKLFGFDDLEIIDRYATRFGLDPDWVFDHTSFGTVMNFAVKWKLEDEYRERFNFIWHEINQSPQK